MFLNDIPEILVDFLYTAFADDLSIYTSGTDLNDAVSKMNDKLCELNVWLTRKGLCMNFDKIKYMIIRKKQFSQNMDNLLLLTVM